MSKQDKRRIVLIDHHFQLRMAAAFILLQILLTGLFAGGLYLFMDSEVHASLATAHASYQSMSQVLLPVMVILSIFSIVLSILLTTIFVVFLSHRIAGPLYRFRTVLEALAHRHVVAHANLRPGDQLGELANTLEEALDVVRADMNEIRQRIRQLHEANDKGDSEAVRQGITGVERALESWVRD